MPRRICDRWPSRKVRFQIEPVQRSVLLKHELLQSPPEKSFLVHGGEVAKWRHCRRLQLQTLRSLPCRGRRSNRCRGVNRAEEGLRAEKAILVSRPSSSLEIIEFWRAMPLGKPPFIHPEDLPAIRQNLLDKLAMELREDLVHLS